MPSKLLSFIFHYSSFMKTKKNKVRRSRDISKLKQLKNSGRIFIILSLTSVLWRLNLLIYLISEPTVRTKSSKCTETTVNSRNIYICEIIISNNINYEFSSWTNFSLPLIALRIMPLHLQVLDKHGVWITDLINELLHILRPSIHTASSKSPSIP